MVLLSMAVTATMLSAKNHVTWLFFPLATHSLFLSCGAGQSIWKEEGDKFDVGNTPSPGMMLFSFGP